MPLFEDVIGLEGQKQYLRERMLEPLDCPETEERAGTSLIRRALLMGDHGTGKTYLAMAVADEAGIEVFRADLHRLVNLASSDVEDALRILFDKALAAEPSLVLVEGCDSLLNREGKTETQKQSTRFFCEALDRLEETNERRVYVIAICNRDLDARVVNRMGFPVLVPSPGGRERKEALQRFLHRRLGPTRPDPPERSAVDGLIEPYRWDQLVGETSGWSYRLLWMYCGDVIKSSSPLVPYERRGVFDRSPDSAETPRPLPRWQHFEAAFQPCPDPPAESRQRESERMKRKREEKKDDNSNNNNNGANKKNKPNEVEQRGSTPPIQPAPPPFPPIDMNEPAEEIERREPTPPIQPALPPSTLFDKMLLSGIDEPSATAYQTILEENDVDEKMLPKMTASQLDRMGIAKIGHQIKLLGISAPRGSHPARKSPPLLQQEPRATTPASIPRKNCVKCDEEKPATREFFFFMEKRRDLNSLCKNCEMEHASKTRTCSVCHEKIPATTEYFYARNSRKGGLRSDCISCSKKIAIECRHKYKR